MKLITGLQIAVIYKSKYMYCKLTNGSDWIRLVFAHLFPLNSGAPIASAHRILGLQVDFKFF